MSKREGKLLGKKPIASVARHEGVIPRDGTASLQAAQERLKAGEAYQPGDTVRWYDEGGKPRFVRVDAVHSDNRTLTIQPTLPGDEGPNFDPRRHQPLPPHQTIDQEQMDKFCRGVRADVARLLHQLFQQINGLTESIPLQEIAEALRTGDRSKVPELQTDILRNGLKQAIKDFYYADTPNYQTLIDAIAAIADHTSTTVAARTGFEFTRIRNLTDVHTLLREVFGATEIPPGADITVMGGGTFKYASRLNVCSQAALAVFQTWLKENPQSWQMGTAVDE